MLRASWMIPGKNSQTRSCWLLSFQDKCIFKHYLLVGRRSYLNEHLLDCCPGSFSAPPFPYSLSPGGLGSDDLLDVRN